MLVAVSLCVCVPHVRGYVCVHGVSEIVSISLCQPSCVSRVLAEGSTLLQDLLREHLLDNQHRLAVNLHPDPDFTNKREAQEKERLQAIAKTLSPSALDTIKQEQEVRVTHPHARSEALLCPSCDACLLDSRAHSVAVWRWRHGTDGRLCWFARPPPTRRSC